MTEYEKLKRITVPLDHLLLVTTEIYADHSKVIDSVLKLLRTSGRLVNAYEKKAMAG